MSDISAGNQTEWNGGTFKNMRIHSIIEGISMCAHNLDISRWLIYLQRFDKELRGFKTEKEKGELDIKLKDLAEKINKYNSNRANTHMKNKGVPAEIVNSLNEFEDKLWDIFTRSGLETKLAKDSRHAFG